MVHIKIKMMDYLTINKFSRSLTWKIFVMGPFSINLTINVLLKNQEKNWSHFLIDGLCKKGTDFQSTCRYF